MTPRAQVFASSELLDNALNTAPVFVLVGLFVGLAAGAAGIWLKVRELSK